MKKYYLHNGTEQQGPFDLDEMKSKDLTKNTPVWFAGLSEWTTVGDVKELNDLLVSTPPPINKFAQSESSNTLDQSQSNTSNRKQNYVRLVIIGGIVIVIFWIGFSFLGNRNTSSYYENVMTVEEMEKADPTKFLESSGTFNENFWGDKLTISGKVKNTATVAKYKDVVIRVTFYTKTQTVITTEDYIIYDFFPANKTKDFKIKVTNYKHTEKLGWEAVGATPY